MSEVRNLKQKKIEDALEKAQNNSYYDLEWITYVVVIKKTLSRFARDYFVRAKWVNEQQPMRE